jgi:hypothetical protein
MRERRTGFGSNTMQAGRHRCSTRSLCAAAAGEMSDHASNLAKVAACGSTAWSYSPTAHSGHAAGQLDTAHAEAAEAEAGTKIGSLQVELNQTAVHPRSARRTCAAAAAAAHAVQRDGHHSASLPAHEHSSPVAASAAGAAPYCTRRSKAAAGSRPCPCTAGSQQYSWLASCHTTSLNQGQKV